MSPTADAARVAAARAGDRHTPESLPGDHLPLAEARVDLDRELRLIAQATGFLSPAEQQILALWLSRPTPCRLHVEI